MTLDLDLYRRAVKPIVKVYMDRHKGENQSKLIGDLASDTYCHIIAIAHFVGELYGMDPETQRILDVAIAFYKCDVINTLDTTKED